MNRRSRSKGLVAIFLMALVTAAIAPDAGAVQLDWNGQFWFDYNWLNNYQLSRARPGHDNDPEFVNNGSPYVPGAGEKNVTWYAAFLKLKPKLVVNDSVNIKSELHLGSPIYGFLGRGFPSSGDARFDFTGSQRDSMTVGAQRYWANIITDFGTFELGRAPLHWGLGAIWNAGDNLFDRYQSTGDMVRLTSKFGNFSIQPALVKVSTGSNVAGASAGGSTIQGNDDVTDIDVALKYDNSEEDFELGVMWTRRSGNTAQKSIFFNRSQTGSTRIDYNLFDFYSRKKWGRFWFGGELPLFNGNLGAIDGTNEFEYKAYAVVFEGGYASDLWDVGIKAGHIPGQPPSAAGDTKFRAVFLNNNYNLGLIMFHYNLYGLSGNNPDTVASGSLNSPYDATLVNANYVSVSPELKLDKWTLRSTFVVGYADEVAKAGNRFYNHDRRSFHTAVRNQSSFLGWEADLGVSLRWDENVLFAWDFGLWFPGEYYEFSNSPGVAKLDSDMMWSSQVKVGVTF